MARIAGESYTQQKRRGMQPPAKFDVYQHHEAMSERAEPPTPPIPDDLEFHDVGPVEMFERERPRPVKIGAREIAVAWLDGRFFAFKDACPHYGTPLSIGFVKGTGAAPTVVCREHGWSFALADGACVGPAEALADGCRLRVYPTRVTAAGRLEIGV